MRIVLERAVDDDAAAIAALRLAAARDLTARFGHSTWSFAAESEAGVRVDLHAAPVYVVRDGATLVATLRLATRKPWLGTIAFFTPCDRPLYLTSMAVRPDRQRRGVGRAVLEEVPRIAAELNGEAIRLDTYDAAAGAAEFYQKCGFREVGRAPYHGTPLVFFERLL